MPTTELGLFSGRKAGEHAETRLPNGVLEIVDTLVYNGRLVERKQYYRLKLNLVNGPKRICNVTGIQYQSSDISLSKVPLVARKAKPHHKPKLSRFGHHVADTYRGMVSGLTFGHKGSGITFE